MRNKEGSFTVQKSMNLTDCEMISKVFFINILDLYKGRVQVSPKMIEFRFFSKSILLKSPRRRVPLYSI